MRSLRAWYTRPGDRRRRLAFAGGAALVLLLLGCGPSRRLERGELALVADFFEDLAHGRDRDWRELVADDGSLALRRIAVFARGEVVDGRSVAPPVPFDRRRRRWSLVATALSDGQATIDRTGQLHLGPDVADDMRPFVVDLLSAENVDRMQGARTLVYQAALDPRSHRAERLIGLIRQAQVHHARICGGGLWQAPSR